MKLTHIIGDSGNGICGMPTAEPAIDRPTCPECAKALDMITARATQDHLNRSRRTSPMKEVQAVRLMDGRRLAVMRQRRDKLEVWPLDGARLQAGDTVQAQGVVKGNPCVVDLVVGGRCGPRGKWRALRKVGMQITIKAKA